MKVFYFWESRPGHSFPSYLELCVETWSRNIPGAEVVRVTHDNLAELSGGRVDVMRLKTFTLPLQSDIAAVAVLSEQPGLFMDADTVIFPGFDPEAYRGAWLTMYGDATHSQDCHSISFFVSTRSKNPLLLSWLAEANRRIAKQTTGWNALRWGMRRRLRGKAARVGWNYLGNAILDPLIAQGGYGDVIDLRDIQASGYSQISHFTQKYAHVRGYHDLWYDQKIPVDEVLAAARDKAVCLQHSWTPDWYSALSREAILADNHLVSRVIQHAVGRG